MALVKKCRHRRAGLDPRICDCAWYADVYQDGKRRFINVGGNYTEARAKHARIVADVLEGRVRRERAPRVRGTQFAIVAQEWLAGKAAEGARPATMQTYRSHVARLSEYWGHVPLAAVTVDDVNDFIDTVRSAQSANYASQLWTTCKAIFSFAEERGVIERAPLPQRKLRFKRATAVPFTLSEIEQGIASIKDPVVQSLAEFVYLTGLRIGEALALDPTDLHDGYITVRRTFGPHGYGPPKTEKSIRSVTLSPRAADLLRKRPQDGRRYWPLSYDQVQRRLRVEVHGRRITWHTFRHANAALRARASQDVRTQRDQLGHANIQRTASYGWASSEDAAKLDAARG